MNDFCEPLCKPMYCSIFVAHFLPRIVHFLLKTVKPNRTHTLPGPPLFTNCSLFASCTNTITHWLEQSEWNSKIGDYQTSWLLGEVSSSQTMWSGFQVIFGANWPLKLAWLAKLVKTTNPFHLFHKNLSFVKNLSHYSATHAFTYLAPTGASVRRQ